MQQERKKNPRDFSRGVILPYIHVLVTWWNFSYRQFITLTFDHRYHRLHMARLREHVHGTDGGEGKALLG